MAKTTAPLLSFGGSGQIGKTQVYSKWKGVNYARRYVIPANPNSSGQQLTRNTFKYLSAYIKLAGTNQIEVWTAFAKGRPLTLQNAFLQANIGVLRALSENTDMVLSKGANGGIAADAISTSVATDTITVTLTAPTLPTGWAIVQAVAVATLQQDPQSYTDPTSVEGTDTSTPYAVDLTVSGAGTWVVGGWFKYNAGTSDAPIYKYGPAISTTAVVS